jgi:hypothetical protein
MVALPRETMRAENRTFPNYLEMIRLLYDKIYYIKEELFNFYYFNANSSGSKSMRHRPDGGS